MSAFRYVPARGDVVWMNLGPRIGHEQAGHRPVLVLSPEHYNARRELALVCPSTSRVKGYPFEVGVPVGSGVSGVVLADRIKSVDWRARGVRRIDQLPAEFVEEVAQKFSMLLS